MKLKDMLSGMGQDTEKQILHDLTCGIYKSQFIGAECRTSDCQGLEEMQMWVKGHKVSVTQGR